MTASNDKPPPARRSMLGPSVVGITLLVAAVAGTGLYGMAQPAGKNIAAAGACAKSLDAARAIDPLIHGEVAALQAATQANDLASVAFDDADGKRVTVGSFKGKTILLNLWATWCVPCRAEMPSLDKLQASAGSDTFSVIPVSIDTTARLEKARNFFKETGVTKLPFYSDASGDILHAFKQIKVAGLPTSILIGPDGCEIATMGGPADWASSDAKTLIQRLGQSKA